MHFGVTLPAQGGERTGGIDARTAVMNYDVPMLTAVVTAQRVSHEHTLSVTAEVSSVSVPCPVAVCAKRLGQNTGAAARAKHHALFWPKTCLFYPLLHKLQYICLLVDFALRIHRRGQQVARARTTLSISKV